MPTTPTQWTGRYTNRRSAPSTTRRPACPPSQRPARPPTRSTAATAALPTITIPLRVAAFALFAITTPLRAAAFAPLAAVYALLAITVPLLTAAALLLAATALTAAQAAAQQPPVTISGRILNATAAAASPVPGLPVTLHMQTTETQDSISALADAQGRFQFADITPDPAVTYAVSVRYQDALYGAQINLRQGNPPPITINVYEAAYDLDVIRVDSSSLLFADADRATQTIAALEIVKVVNDSDRTFVPGSQGPMSLLRFGLPPGSEALQVDTRLLGADIVQVDRGFAVLGSVPPGAHDIMFTYTFPYDGAETTIAKSFPFGANSLRVLSPQEILDIHSADIGAAQPVSIGERPYRLIEAADIERGRRISVRLSDLPRATLTDRAATTLAAVPYHYTPAAALSLFLAALIIFALTRRRPSPPTHDAPTSQDSAPSA